MLHVRVKQQTCVCMQESDFSSHYTTIYDMYEDSQEDCMLQNVERATIVRVLKNSAVSSLNDDHPVALTPIPMMLR